MSDPSIPESHDNEQNQTFDQLLAEYEKDKANRAQASDKGREATVVAVTSESVFLDIGYKTEGIMPLSVFQDAGETVKPGDKLFVSVKGRDPEGYYELVRGKVARPIDWAALEKAFAEKQNVAGTVTGVIKGGLSVDVGVRAFMPASRSGVRDASEMEKLVGQDIRCRIIKLDVTDEDVVVDRRIVAEEEERAAKGRRFEEIKEGETVTGTVRSLTDYGAFIDLGGVDGLLHIAEISWGHVDKPSDLLSVGQEVETKVLKVDTDKQRISLGLKQLQPQPWDTVLDKYKAGERIQGTVTRIADFGAFVELEPGVEGLIHISEMSWTKRVKKPSDIVKPGDTVEAVILAVNAEERRISLGLKQALGDPWADAAQRFAAGSMVEGPVTSLQKFGAFVQVAEGIEGMVHVSDISAEKRINHPQDVLKLGQRVKAQVLEVDTERRRLRLGMKQLVPTSVEEYIAEHHVNDVVTGRIAEISGGSARVELGEGIQATCSVPAEGSPKETQAGAPKPDLSSLTSMLQARWKGETNSTRAKREPAREGQVRRFRMTKLDPAAKKIEVEIAE